MPLRFCAAILDTSSRHVRPARSALAPVGHERLEVSSRRTVRALKKICHSVGGRVQGRPFAPLLLSLAAVGPSLTPQVTPTSTDRISAQRVSFAL